MKRGQKVPETKQVRIPTPDQWHPTAEDGTVSLSFCQVGDGTWRVAAWGEDDFGLEKDFLSRPDAIELFRRLSRCSMITQKQLRDLGFYNA